MVLSVRCERLTDTLFRFAGGSISNLYAFLAARHKMFPQYKEKGLTSIKGQLVMYTSNQVGAVFL